METRKLGSALRPRKLESRVELKERFRFHAPQHFTPQLPRTLLFWSSDLISLVPSYLLVHTTLTDDDPA
jgi:hypothetical protein